MTEERRVTMQGILDQISDVQYHVFNDKQTVCCLTMKNGFTMIGESACVDPANYDEVIGNKIAYDDAVDNLWMVEGYLLQEKLYGDRS